MYRRDAAALILVLSSALPAAGQEIDGMRPSSSSSLPAGGEEERSYLLRKQQEIFRLNVETDYALALQKLCQTGYGDPRLCQPAPPKVASPPAVLLSSPPAPKTPPALPGGPSEPSPKVQEISGVGQDLTAVLQLQDGRRVSVRSAASDHAAVQLPGGASILAVKADHVLLKRSGREPLSLPVVSPSTGESPAPAMSLAP
jgi:type IV pilus biogenesis protein PilP